MNTRILSFLTILTILLIGAPGKSRAPHLGECETLRQAYLASNDTGKKKEWQDCRDRKGVYKKGGGRVVRSQDPQVEAPPPAKKGPGWLAITFVVFLMNIFLSGIMILLYHFVVIRNTVLEDILAIAEDNNKTKVNHKALKEDHTKLKERVDRVFKKHKKQSAKTA